MAELWAHCRKERLQDFYTLIPMSIIWFSLDMTVFKGEDWLFGRHQARSRGMQKKENVISRSVCKGGGLWLTLLEQGLLFQGDSPFRTQTPSCIGHK